MQYLVPQTIFFTNYIQIKTLEYFLTHFAEVLLVPSSVSIRDLLELICWFSLTGISLGPYEDTHP